MFFCDVRYGTVDAFFCFCFYIDICGASLCYGNGDRYRFYVIFAIDRCSGCCHGSFGESRNLIFCHRKIGTIIRIVHIIITVLFPVTASGSHNLCNTSLAISPFQSRFRDIVSLIIQFTCDNWCKHCTALAGFYRHILIFFCKFYGFYVVFVDKGYRTVTGNCFRFSRLRIGIFDRRCKGYRSGLFRYVSLFAICIVCDRSVRIITCDHYFICIGCICRCDNCRTKDWIECNSAIRFLSVAVCISAVYFFCAGNCRNNGCYWHISRGYRHGFVNFRLIFCSYCKDCTSSLFKGKAAGRIGAVMQKFCTRFIRCIDKGSVRNILILFTALILCFYGNMLVFRTLYRNFSVRYIFSIHIQFHICHLDSAGTDRYRCQDFLTAVAVVLYCLKHCCSGSVYTECSIFINFKGTFRFSLLKAPGKALAFRQSIIHKRKCSGYVCHSNSIRAYFQSCIFQNGRFCFIFCLKRDIVCVFACLRPFILSRCIILIFAKVWITVSSLSPGSSVFAFIGI